MSSQRWAITSWGWRGPHRLWRVRWAERPGMVAELTGPRVMLLAFLKLNPETLERLPWRSG